MKTKLLLMAIGCCCSLFAYSQSDDRNRTSFRSVNKITLKKTFLKSSKTLAVLDSGVLVDLIDLKHRPYYRIYSEGLWGYVTESQLKESSGFDIAKSQMILINRYIRKYGEELGLGMYYKVPTIGMTANFIYDILGQPTHINNSTYSWGTESQWVYERYGKTEYYYFKGNKLTAIQD